MTFSTWTDLISGVSQGSVLGPLFFNTYSNDLFFFLQEINFGNFADDTTPFVCDKTFESVLDKLEGNSERVIFWFENNYRAYSNSLLHVIIAHNHLPFFKIFSNFIHFSPNFQIFCPFFVIFLKNCMHALTF